MSRGSLEIPAMNRAVSDEAPLSLERRVAIGLFAGLLVASLAWVLAWSYVFSLGCLIFLFLPALCGWSIYLLVTAPVTRLTP